MAIDKNNVTLKHGKRGFTTVLNSTINLIRDPGALAVYVYLMSKPENWVVREKDLMNRFSKGRDYIRSCVRILKELGLYEVINTRNERGVYTSKHIIIHSEQSNRPPENPPVGKPVRRETNPLSNKRDIQKKEKILTPPIVPPEGDSGNATDLTDKPGQKKSSRKKVTPEIAALFHIAWNEVMSNPENPACYRLHRIKTPGDAKYTNAIIKQWLERGKTAADFKKYLTLAFNAFKKWIFGTWGDGRKNTFESVSRIANVQKLIDGVIQSDANRKEVLNNI